MGHGFKQALFWVLHLANMNWHVFKAAVFTFLKGVLGVTSALLSGIITLMHSIWLWLLPLLVIYGVISLLYLLFVIYRYYITRPPSHWKNSHVSSSNGQQTSYPKYHNTGAKANPGSQLSREQKVWNYAQSEYDYLISTQPTYGTLT